MLNEPVGYDVWRIDMAPGNGNPTRRLSRSDLIAIAFLVIVGAFMFFMNAAPLREGSNHVGKAKADLAVFRDAIDQFRVDCDRYPSTSEGIGALREVPPNAPHWRGPYLNRAIDLDPWGRPYVYRQTTVGGKDGYIIESYGADGKPGGEGDDADIIDGSD